MIEVLESGQLNSVQDLGRQGLRSIGVGTSGVMDSLALRTGNILVGNCERSAGIEVQTFPFQVRFDHPIRFAVTGADAPATLDGVALPPWWTMAARTGQVLRIDRPRTGARAYLTVSGGFQVSPTMGSRSTNMRNGFGGLDGRALVKGDRIETTTTPVSRFAVGANLPKTLVSASQEFSVRVVPGAELGLLRPDSRTAFWNSPWTVTAQSDRGGYRLRGPAMQLSAQMEMRSYGVVAGIIQLPPSGQPIVQLSDANTAGGYPRLGGVIEADLHRLGQAAPGTAIRFVETDFVSAQTAQREIEDFLNQLQDAIAARRPHSFATEEQA